VAVLEVIENFLLLFLPPLYLALILAYKVREKP